MGKSQAEEAKAVECGYWHLWRFNPALEEEGKNPMPKTSAQTASTMDRIVQTVFVEA